MNILPKIRIFGPQPKKNIKNIKQKKRSHLLIFGPKGEEILGPNPLLNAKLIRFGPLCHENPVFSLFFLFFSKKKIKKIFSPVPKFPVFGPKWPKIFLFAPPPPPRLGYMALYSPVVEGAGTLPLGSRVSFFRSCCSSSDPRRSEHREQPPILV